MNPMTNPIDPGVQHTAVQDSPAEVKESPTGAVPSQGATNVGVSPITAEPGAIPRTERGTRDITAPAPVTGADESARDDAAVSSSRWRFKTPDWFTILWMNKKARVGMVMLAAFVLVAAAAPLLAPYDPHDSSFASSLQPNSAHWL